MTENYNFKIEIKQIMIALGDSFNPLEESISLMETVVLDYLENILQETYRLRKTNTIGIKELLLLFKDDENTLGRINYYLDFADISKEARVAVNDVISKPKSSPRCKNVKIEEEKKNRRIRLNELANLLTPDQYLIFSKARNARLDSDDDGEKTKFYNWVISNLRNSDIGFDSIIEILAYLGHELVAEIIEVILLMRKDLSSEDLTHKSVTIHPTDQPPITTSEIKKAMEKIIRINYMLENNSSEVKGLKELFTEALADMI